MTEEASCYSAAEYVSGTGGVDSVGRSVVVVESSGLSLKGSEFVSSPYGYKSVAGNELVSARSDKAAETGWSAGSKVSSGLTENSMVVVKDSIAADTVGAGV